MNSPLCIILASVFIAVTRAGCDAPSGQMPDTGAPFDPAKRFAAVCKVGEHGGDGTLIAPEWVLTAAHVADGMYRRTAGNLQVQFDNGMTAVVRAVYLHPGYAPLGRNDIALLQLREPVAGILPIRLHRTMDELHGTIFLAGHGDRRGPDGGWVRDGRQHVGTNRVDSVNETALIFDYDPPGPDATAHEGTCGPGDSGGPAFLGQGTGLSVAGVSSMGEPGIDGPGTFGAVEHFVRVSSYAGWLDAVMSGSGNNVPLQLGQTDAPVGRTAGTTTGQEPRRKLEGSEQGRMAITMVDALGSGNDEQIEQAIQHCYGEAVLAKRDARSIMRNMPALLEALRGAHLVAVHSVEEGLIGLEMGKAEARFQLDLFFSAEHRMEQMGFRRLDQ